MVTGSRHMFAGLALAVGLVACTASEKGVGSARPGDPVIVLTEGACDQTCPVYDMTLHPDGSYLLNGARFVKTTGVTEGRLDVTVLQGVVHLVIFAVYLFTTVVP